MLFEARPAFLPFVSPSLFAGVVFLLLVFVLYSTLPYEGSVAGTASSGSFLQLVAILLGVLAVLGVVATIVRWYHTSYAITSRRVAKKVGVYARRIVDARFDKIQCVTLTETGTSRISGYGNLLFSVSAPGGSNSIHSGLVSGGILWTAIRDPIRVRVFVERVMDLTSKWDRTGSPLEIVEE